MADEKNVGAKIFAALTRIEAEQKAQRALLEDIKKELAADLDLEGEEEDPKDED